MQQRIRTLRHLYDELLSLFEAHDKVRYLSQQPAVSDFLQKHPWLQSMLLRLSVERQLIIYQIVAIEEGPIVFRTENNLNLELSVNGLIDLLLPIDHFYKDLGGIIGYHLTVLRLLQGEDLSPYRNMTVRYSKPVGMDLRKDTLELRTTVIKGIQAAGDVAELYTVGGAGERLNLVDSNGTALPVARLSFGGAGTLLDWLMRDLQAREYLHYKLYNKQVTTPVLLMTSEERGNHQHMIAMCEDKRWYGRPIHSFFIFSQPQVPVITATGHWVMDKPFLPKLKPGGHGVIWKLAQDSGAFNWLKKQAIRKILVRQINNPIAGLDHGLLAFLGQGIRGNKHFGFASCDRQLGAAEGMNVRIETAVEGGGFEYRITNVEYTDFEKHHLTEKPIKPGSPYSDFPANTNILFVDLNSVEKAISRCPIPGMLLNMKSKAIFVDSEGKRSEVSAGRLESTMQNIADEIVNRFSYPLPESESHRLDTFITFNDRRKTLAVVKNGSVGKAAQLGTPEHCYYELMCSYRDLLTQYCEMKLPHFPSAEELKDRAPPVLLQLHPGLGPLYGLIAEKIRGGILMQGAHLVLEIADLEMIDLQLQGSLQIRADQILGHFDEGQLQYSNLTGKCTLRRVEVINLGVDLAHTPHYWEGTPICKEALRVHLHGNGEFHAQGVIFRGGQTIEVNDGERITAENDSSGGVILHRETITQPTWCFDYSVDHQLRCHITRKKGTKTIG